MITLEQMVPEMLDTLSLQVGDEGSGLVVSVVELAFDLPMEAQIGDAGQLLVSAPRGRLATGFDPQHGRLRARFVREAP